MVDEAEAITDLLDKAAFGGVSEELGIVSVCKQLPGIE